MDVTLERTGKKSLRLTNCAELAGLTTPEVTGRWTEHTLYRTQAGRYVLHTVHRTCWQGEQDVYTALVADTAGELVDAMIRENGGFVSDAMKDLCEEAAFADAQFDNIMVTDLD